MYAVFFDYNNSTYRLPVNPEEIQVSSTQAIDKYEVLKLGQIAVPTHMELMQYSFECEFPLEWNSYVEVIDSQNGPSDILNKNQLAFQSAGYYIKLFSEWRNLFVPVRFLAGRVIEDEKLYRDSINTMVLIEDLTIKEKAGEEGDKYISFKLLEYREFTKIKAVTENKLGGVVRDNKSNKTDTNPNNKGFYVVQSGDCLWAIAKKYYGDGAKYTKIYNANKDKIKNPSLIYPGQKLVIP